MGSKKKLEVNRKRLRPQGFDSREMSPPFEDLTWKKPIGWNRMTLMQQLHAGPDYLKNRPKYPDDVFRVGDYVIVERECDMKGNNPPKRGRYDAIVVEVAEG